MMSARWSVRAITIVAGIACAVGAVRAGQETKQVGDPGESPPAVELEGHLVRDPVPPGSATGTAASDGSSVPASRVNYRIGPGDVVDIRVLGEDKMSSVVKVTEDGFIRFPFIDEDIAAQCLTERELGKVITEKLKKYLKYPEVFVGVKEYNSTPVAIIGAVNTPGRFQMQRRVRLIELVTFAGGVRPDAGKTLTIIHLPGGVACDSQSEAPSDPTDAVADATESISLMRLLEGDADADRVMRPGDIVILPVADLVFVAGEVLKPNSYPLREGMTLTQVLSLAGGPSAVAKTDAVRVVRQEPGKEKDVIVVDLKLIQANTIPDVPLMANDVIEIPGSSGKKFMRSLMSTISGTAGSLPLRAIP